MGDEIEEGRRVRPILDTLREIEGGQLLEALSEAQNRVVNGVQLTARKGRLTLTIDYAYEADGQISTVTDIKEKVPALPRGRTLFFATPESNLQRQDPRQGSLSLTKPQYSNQPKAAEEGQH